MTKLESSLREVAKQWDEQNGPQKMSRDKSWMISRVSGKIIEQLHVYKAKGRQFPIDFPFPSIQRIMLDVGPERLSEAALSQETAVPPDVGAVVVTMGTGHAGNLLIVDQHQ